MEYKETECKTCGTKSESLFYMPKAIDSKDFFCKKHMEEEMVKRGKGE